jgi:methionine-S-sulfoxide reductase
VPDPSYEAVCAGTTGHAEVVQVTYDPSIISFQDILQVFFTIHDPTTLNRQGADVGTQYRSAIYYHTPAQEEISAAVIQELEAAGVWDGKIVTEVSPAETFYPAEDYHQDFFCPESVPTLLSVCGCSQGLETAQSFCRKAQTLSSVLSSSGQGAPPSNWYCRCLAALRLSHPDSQSAACSAPLSGR